MDTCGRPTRIFNPHVNTPLDLLTFPEVRLLSGYFQATLGEGRSCEYLRKRER